jgi:NAD(P)-dependent dehydrogenase (short-subunit alcohol dehydrogenase family)
LEETSEAELRSLFEIHVLGPAALTRAVLPHMPGRRSGTIVQMSSMGGQMSFAGFSASSATKFALEGMSEALADEVRSVKAAAAILTVSDAPTTPLRLPLGDDAVDAISGHLSAVRAELNEWEKVARDTRFPA